jgi:serine/threonine protein kinase
MNPRSRCPEVSELFRLLEGSLPESAELMSHLETCEQCQRRLHELAAGDQTWDALSDRLKSGSLNEPNRVTHAAPELAGVIEALKRHESPTAESAPELSPDLPDGFLAPPTDASHIGRLGDFDVLEEVGRGAMGVVLRGFDRKLHRPVAIKVMSPQLASSALARRRFVREGHSAAAVCHEHVVTIYEVGEHAGLPYLVMQYVSGKTLQQRLDQGGPFRTIEILRIGMQAAAGLAAAHAQGLVHRDIKPANLLLENGVERVKLTDFGLARAVDDASITQSGIITGTPQFMAPEQARGEPVDARADLFSLGCVLYTLATARPPFRASSTLGVLKRICEDEPRPIRQLNPDIPDWLADIVSKLLAKNPADRFPSASALSTLLSECLAHMQQPELHPLPAGVAQRAMSQPPPPMASPQPVDRTPVDATSSRMAWLRTPWGIAALAAAMILPLAVALLNNWIDARFGPQAGSQPAGTERPAGDDDETMQPVRPDEGSAVDLTASSSRPKRESAEVLAQLERLVDVAKLQWQLEQERFEQGLSAPNVVFDAEIAFREAEAQHAAATGEDAKAEQALLRIVELRQEQLTLIKKLVEASVATQANILEAESALTEARLAHERQKQSPRDGAK